MSENKLQNSEKPKNKKSENIHKGHRKRVKDEFLAHGFDEKTPPHKILETLLFFCLPQGDTNPLAHQLLNKYNNSISAVLEAPIEELIQFKGLTESNAVLLKLIMPIARLCAEEENANKKNFKSLSEIHNYLIKRFAGFTEENLGILCLDGACNKISFDIVEKGDLGSVGISVRNIVKLALDKNAVFVIMAHNHPSHIALPSGADIAMTENVAQALSHINVRLIEHVIIADNDCVSMAQTEKYQYLFNK